MKVAYHFVAAHHRHYFIECILSIYKLIINGGVAPSDIFVTYSRGFTQYANIIEDIVGVSNMRQLDKQEEKFTQKFLCLWKSKLFTSAYSHVVQIDTDCFLNGVCNISDLMLAQAPKNSEVVALYKWYAKPIDEFTNRLNLLDSQDRFKTLLLCLTNINIDLIRQKIQSQDYWIAGGLQVWSVANINRKECKRAITHILGLSCLSLSDELVYSIININYPNMIYLLDNTNRAIDHTIMWEGSEDRKIFDLSSEFIHVAGSARRKYADQIETEYNRLVF